MLAINWIVKGYLVKFKLPSNRNELSVEEIINRLIHLVIV